MSNLVSAVGTVIEEEINVKSSLIVKRNLVRNPISVPQNQIIELLTL